MPEPVTEELDASGLQCPMPLLLAKRALNRLAAGNLLRVVATDAGSVRDFAAFTDQAGHQLLHSDAANGQYIYLIRKA